MVAGIGDGLLLLDACRDRAPRPPRAPRPRRAPAATIAVLPFADLSEKQDRGYLSDGLAEELIDLLTKIPELRVTARASSFALRGQPADISAIARQLNVANVLEGSVRASGSRLKISVQLARTSDGTVIWSETYDREMKDIFEIQEEVAAAVVDALKLRLLSGTRPFSRAAHRECSGLRGVSARPAVSRWSVGRAAPACAGRVPARRGTAIHHSHLPTQVSRSRPRTSAARRCRLLLSIWRSPRRNGRWRWRRA